MRVVLLVLVLAIGLAQDAIAADEPTGPQLQTPAAAALSLQRGLTPDGVAVLTLTGILQGGTTKRVKALLAEQPVQSVLLNSIGGGQNEAMQLGRLLRQSSVSTHVPEGAVCLSACVYVLAGGLQRSVATSARVGSHVSRLPADPQVMARSEDIVRKWGIVAALQAYDAAAYGDAAGQLAYFREMGVSSEILEASWQTPTYKMRDFTSAEMAAWNLISRQ